MILRILNKSLFHLANIDIFKSVIWTERFILAGEFELIVPYTEQYLSLFKEGFYVLNSQTSQVFYIDSVLAKRPIKSEATIIVKGKSCSGLLARRIELTKSSFITQSIIGFISNVVGYNGGHLTSEASRRLDYFKMEAETDEEYLLNTPVFYGAAQYLYTKNIYTVVTDTLSTNGNVGLKVELDMYSETPEKIKASLYVGKDRRINQVVNSPVAFTVSLGNLLAFNKEESDATEKNMVLVIGGSPEVVDNEQILSTDLAIGTNRKEVYVDSKSLKLDSDMTEVEYVDSLIAKGIIQLSESQPTKTITSEVDYTTFTYGRDYYLGDIVTISDGLTTVNARVTEMIMSQDENGSSMVPTFEII